MPLAPFRLLAAVTATMLACGGAGAAVLTANSAVGGAAAGAVRENFDSLTPGAQGTTLLPSGLTIGFGGDAAALVGDADWSAAPYLSGQNGAGFGNAAGVDTSVYLNAGSTQVSDTAGVIFTLPYVTAYFGLLWGSVDVYNSLSFYRGDTLIGTLTGSDIPVAVNGDQGVEGTLYVNITSAIGFDRVVAFSDGYAFEFDNVAFARAVPEPVSLVLLGTGLAGLGLAMARRRRPQG